MSSDMSASSLQPRSAAVTDSSRGRMLALVRNEDRFQLVMSDNLWSLFARLAPNSLSLDSSASAQIYSFNDLQPLLQIKGLRKEFTSPADLINLLSSTVNELLDLSSLNVSANLNELGLLDLSKLVTKSFDLEPQAREHFENIVQAAQSEMAQNNLQKIVPVVFEYASIDPENFELCAWLLTLVLLQSAQDKHFVGSFPYAIIDFDKREGVWGITPELLWTKTGNQLQTMAVAGTYHESKHLSREEFVRDPKEGHEHRLVVRDISERLFSHGALSVGPTQLKRTGRLEHLVTPIQLLHKSPSENKAPSKSVDWTKMLHPTAALGVYPPSQAQLWMERLSIGDRTHFGAPLHFQWGETDLALVAIRQLSLVGSQLRVGSGCGVVQASEIDREWEELNQKREAVKRIFFK